MRITSYMTVLSLRFTKRTEPNQKKKIKQNFSKAIREEKKRGKKREKRKEEKKREGKKKQKGWRRRERLGKGKGKFDLLNE